jgi:cytochrome c553
VSLPKHIGHSLLIACKASPSWLPPPLWGREPNRSAILTYVIATFVIAALTFATDAHAAGNAKNGRQKALQCQTCHGLDGLSKLPEAPHIAGQPEPYLIKTMTEYRTGVRQNEMMTVVAKELSDQDIVDLAAYYTSIEVSVTVPKR